MSLTLFTILAISPAYAFNNTHTPTSRLIAGILIGPSLHRPVHSFLRVEPSTGVLALFALLALCTRHRRMRTRGTAQGVFGDWVPAGTAAGKGWGRPWAVVSPADGRRLWGDRGRNQNQNQAGGGAGVTNSYPPPYTPGPSSLVRNDRRSPVFTHMLTVSFLFTASRFAVGTVRGAPWSPATGPP
ncbi:hypothetical protein B0H11DRAFT_2025223 [Mycena galericulata]|nr:hypothetical protein B0H11DRAFT_2025223 [Mycena galericulata]